jgi:hypothetical protein
MDNSISTNRPDVVSVETTARPTATPVRVNFSEVLAGGARALVQGAQAAASVLPGAPLMAVALRGAGSGQGGSTAMSVSASPSLGISVPGAATPEGPGGMSLGATALGVGSAASTGGTSGGIAISLAQSHQMNLYCYCLQVQQKVNDQNRTFTALSNCLEVENNTAKSAISNIH